MSTYNEMIQKDIQLMRTIQKYCYRTPYLDNFISRIISKNPLYDIVIILYVMFALGLMDIGAKHFWLVAMNLSVTFVIRKIIAAKRPIEFDSSMKPLTDRNSESYGFPSLESHMAVVIFGHFSLNYNILFMFPISIVAIGVIGFSRVYSRARFPHQIIGSYVTGLIGLFIGLHCCHFFNFHKMKHRHHVCCVIAVVMFALAHFALCIENNDSQVIGVSKKEFIKVISDIMNVPVNIDGTENAVNDPNGNENTKKIITPRSMALQEERRIAAEKSRKGFQIKRDSFYYMQRGLEQRDGVNNNMSYNSSYMMNSYNSRGNMTSRNRKKTSNDTPFTYFLQPNYSNSNNSDIRRRKRSDFADDGYSSGVIGP